MAFTRTGIPLWIYYQEKTPISNFDDIRENNLYFMMQTGFPCEVVYVREKNVEKNTITVQTLEEKVEKILNLHLFETKQLKFYENEIDP
jgi:hypothetical protein